MPRSSRCTRATSRWPTHVDLRRIARQTSGLTGADLANICNEAAIQAGRAKRDELIQLDFNAAVERVVAGLQQRKLITDKEKRVIAYHEAGHALLARLMSDDIHKVTIVPRGRALGFMMSLPEEDRYVLSKDELEDWLKVTLGGRAAEQIVFGRITNGAANDLERATAIARSMVFEWGMGKSTSSQQMRADNYSLSEQTKQLRDEEQREITDQAYAEALRLIGAHRHHLDLLANALLEEETLERDQIDVLLTGLEPGVRRLRQDRRRAPSGVGPRPSGKIGVRATSGVGFLALGERPQARTGAAQRSVHRDWRQDLAAGVSRLPAAPRRPPRHRSRPSQPVAAGASSLSRTSAISASLAAIRSRASRTAAACSVSAAGMSPSAISATPRSASASFSSFLRLRSCI